jgi:hypothetical protein
MKRRDQFCENCVMRHCRYHDMKFRRELGDAVNFVISMAWWAFLHFFEHSRTHLYFPMQKVEKIRFRISSAVVAPVNASRLRSAE